jgi:hypothetical protein
MFRKGLIIIALVLTTCIVGYAQSTDCPVDKVCISPEAARKGINDASENVALKAQAAATEKALSDMRDELNKMRIEFASKVGENTALKQNAVQDRAIIEVLLKSIRPKKIGIINL